MFLAFSSGLLAGISPCTIPVYPILLSQLTSAKKDPRWVTVFFALGMGGVYILLYMFLGAAASLLGAETLEGILEFRGRLVLLGALVAWIMAYRMLRGVHSGRTIQFLDAKTGGGYLGALVTGFIYGTIISPCNAPFLVTGILPALSVSGTLFEGIILLAVFTFAMNLPLLALGFASSYALRGFSFIKKNNRRFEVFSALFLAVAGFYFMYLFTLTL